MARIRTLKPEFWTDGDIMDLPPQARDLFLGSWNFALCDYGHVADDPRRLRMQVLPGDDTMMVRDQAGAWVLLPMDPGHLVDLIVASGRMDRVEIDGRSFLWIRRFTDHQKLEKRWSPRCPACKALAGTPDPDGTRGTSPNLSETPETAPQDRTGQDRTGPAAAAAGDEPPPRPVDKSSIVAVADLPGELVILRSKLDARKLVVRWDKLTTAHVDEIVNLVQLHGDAQLIRAALNSFRPDNPAAYAQAWLGDWRKIPAPGQTLTLVRAFCDQRGHETVELRPDGQCVECIVAARVGEN